MLIVHLLVVHLIIFRVFLHVCIVLPLMARLHGDTVATQTKLVSNILIWNVFYWERFLLGTFLIWNVYYYLERFLLVNRAATIECIVYVSKFLLNKSHILFLARVMPFNDSYAKTVVKK